MYTKIFAPRSDRAWKPLSRDEERALIRRWKRDPGDREVAEKLIEAYRRQICRAAQYFHQGYGCRHLLVEDLESVGLIVLFHTALPQFSLEEGTRFTTYFNPKLIQAMKVEISRHERTIRVPRDSGHTPPEVYSLDVPVEGTEDFLYGHLIPDPSEGPEILAMEQILKDKVRQLLAPLKPRDRWVVIERYGLNGGGERTYRSLGNELKLSAPGTRNIVDRARAQIRRSVPPELVEDFFSR